MVCYVQYINSKTCLISEAHKDGKLEFTFLIRFGKLLTTKSDVFCTSIWKENSFYQTQEGAVVHKEIPGGNIPAKTLARQRL